jgi:Domain of unknown function (DUF1707)
VSDLRIGTEERELALRALGEHFAAGRLRVEEYEERAGAVVAASTRSELGALFGDLPPPHPAFLAPPALPDDLRGLLAEEGVLVLAEHVNGEIAYRNYRAPGEQYRRRTLAVVGTIAVTGRRLLVWASGAKRVDVRFDEPLRAAVELSVEPPDGLRISVDAGKVHPSRSGRVELRFRTDRAGDIVRLWGTGG